VAGTCVVSGQNPRTVNVPAGGANQANFAITCTAPANQPPTADFGSTCNGLTCAFTSTSSDPDGSIASYEWTFGDGGTSTAPNPSRTYGGTGNYTVTLTVRDNQGATAGASHVVHVEAPPPPPPPNRPPSVNAGPDDRVLLGLGYRLNASFTDPDNGPWDYTVEWGDGTSTSGRTPSPGSISPSHTFILGRFTIRVTVTDSQGLSDSDTMVLDVLLIL
jgi:PKD repeat protein